MTPREPRAREHLYTALTVAALGLVLVIAGAPSALAHPNDACMPIVELGQVDETTLEIDLAVEKTPQLVKLEEGRNDEKRFFIEWTWTITDDAGAVVREITQEAELAPPFETVLLPHCERPGVGNGAGGADEVEHAATTLTSTWNGEDADGEPVPDGEYPFTVSGRLVRAIDTGNPNDDHVNELVVGTFGPAAGSFEVTRLEVVALANPSSGPVPLPVAFSALVEGEAALFEWDFDGDGTFDYSSTRSPDTIYTYRQTGSFQATLRATSPAGSLAISSVTVTALEGLVANIVAHPTSGTRPLTVRFTPEAESAESSVTGYRWDFDGNGIYDTGFDPRPSTRAFTYNQAGTYDALLQVRDQDGGLAEAVQRITVNNPKPTVDVEAVPSNGPAPLEVTFAIAASSPNGSITSVVLDPGDGSPSIERPGPGNVTHTYTAQGTFDASVVVTDSAGETARVDDLTLDVQVGAPGSPTAVAAVTPSSGPAPLSVTFDSTGSFDGDGTLTLFEWDFDYDGTTFSADTSSAAAGTVSHTYTASDTHFAALRVTDDAGLQSLDVVVVLVDLQVVVSVPDDTVNPYQNETVDVVTNLSGGAEVTVFLRDRGGNRVRTLFSGFRPAGTYRDAWDGRSDGGDVLLDGDYYAEAEYQLGGETLVEPDTPSGGSFRFVSWTENYRFGARWDPWEDQFWELTFDTAARGAGASEVTLWITPYFNRNEVTATLLNAEVFGSGRYRQWWAGVKDDGGYVEPRGQRRASGNDYLWSAQAFTLPDNAIVVEGGRPLITGPAADPNVYYPTTHRCLTGQGNRLDLTLSRPGAVTVRIFNMENGNLLRVLTTPTLPAGPNQVFWDGKAASGDYVAPGRYRAEITALSDNGNVSLLRRVLILVTY